MALALYHPKAEGYLFAAYRPIVMQVYLDYAQFGPVPAYPPIVFCDIYFNGAYYRSLSSTAYELVGIYASGGMRYIGVRPLWTFDIQDAAQEYLRSFPPPLQNTAVLKDKGAFGGMKVAFRTSSADSAGFIEPQTPVPVQSDFYSAAVPGGGLFSGNYLVLNATLQHEDNPYLPAHLDAFVLFRNEGYYIRTLSHRSSYVSGVGQYDHTPVYIGWNGLEGSGGPMSFTLWIAGVYRDGTSFASVSSAPVELSGPGLYHFPTGIPQLSVLPLAPAISWNSVAEYTVGLYRLYPLNIAWQSPVIRTDGCVCADGARLHFLNSLGGFDAVNFCEREEVQTTKSSNWQRSLPLVGMRKRDYGNQRFNVRATKTATVRTNAYPESAQEWLEELARSPRAYLEWPGDQGQPPDLIPVRISDGKVTARKTSGRYEYLLEITFEMANEKIMQRG
jgi:hypothetical protein